MNGTGSELIYTVTVPANVESFTVMEGLCETFLTEEEGISSHMALVLRLSVAEACRNALSREPRTGQLAVASLAFLRQTEGGQRGLALEISDPGNGFRVEGKKPPYPDEFVGGEFVILAILGQEIVARVSSPWSVALTNRDAVESSANLTRETLLAGAGEYGLGLLALTRCWDLVEFTFDPHKANLLRLERPRLRG